MCKSWHISNGTNIIYPSPLSSVHIFFQTGVLWGSAEGLGLRPLNPPKSDTLDVLIYLDFTNAVHVGTNMSLSLDRFNQLFIILYTWVKLFLQVSCLCHSQGPCFHHFSFSFWNHFYQHILHFRLWRSYHVNKLFSTAIPFCKSIQGYIKKQKKIWQRCYCIIKLKTKGVKCISLFISLSTKVLIL